jgi:hypothetical protein
MEKPAIYMKAAKNNDGKKDGTEGSTREFDIFYFTFLASLDKPTAGKVIYYQKAAANDGYFSW